MALDDQLQTRFRHIWVDWGQQREVTRDLDLEAIQVAVHAWLMTGQSHPEVVLRATQVLFADPEGQGARREAVTSVMKELDGVWGVGCGPSDLLLLQAMLLVAWPRDELPGSFGLTALMAAGWTGGRVLDFRRKHFDLWWKAVTRVLVRPRVVVEVPELAEVPAGPVESVDLAVAMRELVFLKVNMQQGWTLQQLGPSLVLVLEGFSSAASVIARKRGANSPDVTASLEYFRKHQNSAWQYNKYSQQLCQVLRQFQEIGLDDRFLSAAYKSAFAHLAKTGQAWTYNHFATQLMIVLSAIGDALTAQVDPNSTMRHWVNQDLRKHLTQRDDAFRQLAATLQTSAQPEVELLWWGQAKYSHTLRKPFRRIDDPALVLWLACREVAERAVHLDAEPSAAYLVQNLSELGIDVDERRSVSDWFQVTHSAMSDCPSTVNASLQDLAKVDPLGLPVTWWRLTANTGDDSLIRHVGVSPTLEIDRGEWATWVLRELLLDLRMAS